VTTIPPELDLRFRAAAADEGLLDVAYDLVESPIGQLLVGVSDRGVCRIAFDPEPEAELERLARRLGPRVLRTGRRVEPARRQLGEYFEGRRAEFELDYDLTGIAPFQQEVLHELVRVPYSETSTYGALAKRVGRPRAARAVGGALNRNPIPIVVPCHRIVGSTGSLVGYAGGLERKRALLELEGAVLL
jgi:methylated-DNA-[protein]-cysteine S-methyltransferase